MGKFRSIIARHLGLILALIVVVVGLTISTWVRWPRPRRSWTEHGFSREGTVTPSPDGRRVLMTDEGRIWVHEMASGRSTVLSFDGSSETMRSQSPDVRFLDDGRTVVGFWKIGGAVRVWDAESGRTLFEVTSPAGNQFGFIEFSGDGSTLVFALQDVGRVSSPVKIVAWNRGWSGPRTYNGDLPMALSANGKYLVSGDGKSTWPSMVVREVESGRTVGTVLDKLPANGRVRAISDDGMTLVEARAGETIVWDVASAKLRATLGHDFVFPDEVKLIELPGGGQLVFQPGSRQLPELNVWSLAVDPPRRVFQGMVQAFSPDGRRLVFSSGNEQPSQVVELSSMSYRTGDFEPSPTFREFSRDGRLVALIVDRSTSSDRHPLTSWLPIGSRPRWFDRRAIEIRVVDATDGRRVASITLPLGTSDLTESCLIPDGKGVLVYTRDVTIDEFKTPMRIDLWDVQPRAPVWPVEAALSGLAIGIGIWWDSRRRRRSNKATA